MANSNINPSPSESSNIVYGNTTVKDKLDSLSTDVNNKVSNTGGTISGNITIDDRSTGYSMLTIGNTLNTGATGKSKGILTIASNSKYVGQFADINENGLTDNRGYYIPDKSGTIALTSDVDTIPIKHVNVAQGKKLTINHPWNILLHVAKSNESHGLIFCGETANIISTYFGSDPSTLGIGHTSNYITTVSNTNVSWGLKVMIFGKCTYQIDDI